MSDIAPGYYKGTIQAAHLAAWDDKADELVMVFTVELSGERAGGREVVCEQRCGGQYPDIAVRVAKYLGLDWPDGLENISSTVGREVQVKIKHNTKDGTTYVNAHIQPPRQGREEVDPATAKRLIAQLADGDDSVPF